MVEFFGTVFAMLGYQEMEIGDEILKFEFFLFTQVSLN